MNYIGTQGASGESVTIPDHIPGDLIVISARRAAKAVASKPHAGGTIPAWTDVVSGALILFSGGGISLRTAYAIATRSDHQSGTWDDAEEVIVSVFRPSGGRGLAIVRSSQRQELASSPIVIYPALARDTSATIISSMGYRVAASTAHGENLGTAPSGWTHLWAEPDAGIGVANSSSVMSSSYEPTLTSNPGNDVIAVTIGSGTNPYRAHTLQIAEVAGDLDAILDEVDALSLNQIQVLRHKFFGGRPDYQEAMKYVEQGWAFRRFGTAAAPDPGGLGALPAGEYGGLLHAIQLNIPTLPSGAELAAYVDALSWRSFSPRDWSNLYALKTGSHLNSEWVGPNEWK